MQVMIRSELNEPHKGMCDAHAFENAYYIYM